MQTGKAELFKKNSLISEQILDYPRKHRPYWQVVGASKGTDEINGGLVTMLYQTEQEGNF